MRRHLLLLPLTALASLISAGTAAASDWHTARQGSPAASLSRSSAAGARNAAEQYLKYAAPELDLEGVSLHFRNELATGDHRTVRFVQTHDGLPVLGAAAAVHVTPDSRVKVAVLDVARDLSVPTAPKYDAEAARQAVEATFGFTLPVRPKASLAVFPEKGTGGRLVWVVDVGSETGGERFLVDAHAAKIVHRRPLAVDARGRVYPISSAVTPQLQDRDLVDLDVSDPQTLSGWNGNLKVVNYVDGDLEQGIPLTVEQRVWPNSGADFLYDPPTDSDDAKDQFAQVGVYYHLTRMRDYFTAVHGLDMTTPRWKLLAVANMQAARRPLDNAFFAEFNADEGGPFDAPNLIAIGQGTHFDFADDSDVFLHEFTHYVSSNAVGYNDGQLAVTAYGLSPWGGSIDEGVADYFACTVNDDPSLGEASIALFGMERDLSDSGKRCPDDIVGEVHEDGEIIGSLAWSLREKFGQALSDKLVWTALTLLTPGASLDDFARGIATAADDLVSAGELGAADAAAIEALVKDRGLDDCDEVLDLSGGKVRRSVLDGLDVLIQGTGGSCAQYRAALSLQSLFHFKSTPDPTAKGVRFSVQLDPEGGDDLAWNIYVRADEHVGFTLGDYLPEATFYDYSVEGIKEAYGEIVIDETSNPPFDPAKTYYMVIGHGNCPPARMTVKSVDLGVERPDPVDPVEPEPGSTGGGAAPEPGSTGGDTPDPTDPEEPGTTTVGCACRAAEPSAPVAPWAALSGMALAGAAVLRRRLRARGR